MLDEYEQEIRHRTEGVLNKDDMSTVEAMLKIIERIGPASAANILVSAATIRQALNVIAGLADLM